MPYSMSEKRAGTPGGSRSKAGLKTVDQPRHCRAEMRVGGVPELGDERVPLERLLDDSALDAFAAAVNESNLPSACVVRRAHVLLDDRLDVAGREGVQIEVIFDRNPVRHLTPEDRWR